jgi:CheY-like chemotaxis protein
MELRGWALTLVKWLVELHGGSVEAQSPGLGQGAEFIVRLPLLPGFSPAETRETERAVQTERAARLRVLVVDDHADVLYSTYKLLSLMGHHVHTASNSAAALHTARSFQPQVLLIDIQLPGMDGYELARRLRAEPGIEGALFIAITGYGQETDPSLTRTEQRGLMFDHYLVKPVDFAAIEALLNRAAGDRQALVCGVSEDSLQSERGGKRDPPVERTERPRVEDPLGAQQERDLSATAPCGPHEINQPLMVIMSYLEGARRMFGDVAQANPAFAEFLEEMARNTRRAVDLVRVMRDEGRNAETGASTEVREEPGIPESEQARATKFEHGDAV